MQNLVRKHYGGVSGADGDAESTPQRRIVGGYVNLQAFLTSTLGGVSNPLQRRLCSRY
jgi:hypothetical protein